MGSKQQRQEVVQDTGPLMQSSSSFASFQQPHRNAAMVEEMRLFNGASGPGTDPGGVDEDDDKRELYLRHSQDVVTESNERARERRGPGLAGAQWHQPGRAA